MFLKMVILVIIAASSVWSEHNYFTSYQFNYGKAGEKNRWDYTVNDLKTGDSKSHWETKIGDQGKGKYVVLNAGGSIRKVRYMADKFGFSANVERTIPKRIYK